MDIKGLKIRDDISLLKIAHKYGFSIRLNNGELINLEHYETSKENEIKYIDDCHMRIYANSREINIADYLECIDINLYAYKLYIMTKDGVIDEI